MPNDYINKVVFGSRTLVDLTDTVIDPGDLPIGSVVYNARGERITGRAIIHDVYTGDTEYWNSQIGYIPGNGDIIVYTDKGVIDDGSGTTKNVPGIKMGDGLAYCVDLPFVGDDIAKTLIEHINDLSKHVTEEERARWNNKINCENYVQEETLVLNRN